MRLRVHSTLFDEAYRTRNTSAFVTTNSTGNAVLRLALGGQDTIHLDLTADREPITNITAFLNTSAGLRNVSGRSFFSGVVSPPGENLTLAIEGVAAGYWTVDVAVRRTSVPFYTYSFAYQVE